MSLRTEQEAHRLHDVAEDLAERAMKDPSLEPKRSKAALEYDHYLEANLDELAHITDGCLGEEIQQLLEHREREREAERFWADRKKIDRDVGIEI